MRNKWVRLMILLIAVPAVIALGALLFESRRYAWVTLCVAVLACVPFFLSFERRRDGGTGELLILAIMVALSVVGRILFAPLPGFKPVTALVILTGMYFGGEAGFLTGALSAVVSNFYFGQGPWTPFQMFVWGMIGLLAGLLARPLKKHMAILTCFGALSGVLFSLLMDIWTVLSWDGAVNLSRYLAAVTASAWFTGIYAVSNAVFLLLLAKPIGRKLERIQTKYGL